MTRADLLEIFNGSPDGPLRFLRRVKNGQQMFSGNHNCRRALLEAGMLSVVAQDGKYYRLAITERGLQALEACQP